MEGQYILMHLLMILYCKNLPPPHGKGKGKLDFEDLRKKNKKKVMEVRYTLHLAMEALYVCTFSN